MVKNKEYPISTKKHLAIVAPLDWGLGHTTRCIPIIRELEQNNFNIVIACDSNQKSVLKQEFPDADFVFLPGYGLKYGRSRKSTILKLIFQLPKILISIKREKTQFKRILNQFTPNIVISDNRYGVFSSSIYSVFITHQLKIITGAGSFADRLAMFATHRLIRQFDECWVPDYPGNANFAGALSHPLPLPSFPLRYIGPLSRFNRCGDAGGKMKPGSAGFKEKHILVVLSGPEPQRTILESLLLDQLANFDGKVMIVRGLADEQEIIQCAENITVLNFADSKRLNELICSAEIVICRSGYSSVMDLMKLGKKAVLIPTPGQGEQEYLGQYLGEKKLAVIARQEKLQILPSIARAMELKLPQLDLMDEANMEEYKRTITELSVRLQGRYDQ